MNRTPLDIDRTLRVLLVGAAFIFALGGGHAVMGASVSASTSYEASRLEHDRQCACGTRCRLQSCCCARRASKTTSPAKAITTPAQQISPGPCLNSAPCQDPVAPNGATVEPVGKAAHVESPIACSPFAGGLPLALASLAPAPLTAQFRLERPPRP